jgi:hypothetical protein
MLSSWYFPPILRHYFCPDFRQPWGLWKQQKPDPLEEAPPLEGEGVKQGTSGPANE